MTIVFRTGATASERQAAVDAIQGTVVGGWRIGMDGEYLVRIADDGTANPLVSALSILDGLPQVAAASGVAIGIAEPLAQQLRNNPATGPKLVPSVAKTQVPATPADSVPAAVWQALHDPANMVSSDPRYPAPFPRNLILLTFRENTPQTDRQTAVDAVNGHVIGGSPIGNGGVYFITIPDDGTPNPLFNAFDYLKTLPAVELVSPELLPLSPGYLRPTDDPGWRSRNNPASGPRLVLSVTKNLVPAQPPDSIPAWVFADSNMSPGSTSIAGTFVKNVLFVRFRASATVLERQAAIDSVRGEIVGGVADPSGNGYYIVRVQDPGDGSALLASAARLEVLPQIRIARIEVFLVPNYLAPMTVTVISVLLQQFQTPYYGP
ncbi:MAG TPA: hypothetical protein VLB12_06715 [Gemmatimonadales bacterium]|nr:hypothetical protein [Gemmatimonadales bacterium]